MGSPYIVSTVSTISTIRSLRGYHRVLNLVMRTMDCSGSPHVNADGTWSINTPEDVVIVQLFQAVMKAILKRSREIITLQARYEWQGWEKFQRGIIIDFTHPARDDEKALVATARSTYTEAMLDALVGNEGHLWESASWL